MSFFPGYSILLQSQSPYFFCLQTEHAVYPLAAVEKMGNNVNVRAQSCAYVQRTLCTI